MTRAKQFGLSWEEKAERRFHEGEERGRERGLEVMQKHLIRFLENRFGNVSDDVRKRIESCTNLDALESASEQLFHIESPDQLAL